MEETAATGLVPQADATVARQAIGDTLAGLWRDFLHHLPLIAAAIVALIVTALIASVVARVASRLLAKRRLRSSLKELAVRLMVIAIWTAGILTAAIIVFPGLTPAKALGAMGLASVAIGFAFKDIFENFFAGLLILWRFPFENGDHIVCDDVSGEVQDVTVRMTRIRRTDGVIVVMPNAMLFKQPVQVLTTERQRRVRIELGVAYSEDVEDAVEVIEQAVRGCATVSNDRRIQVFPFAFGASSIDIEVTWWTDSRPIDERRSRGEVVTAIKRALDEADIEIPFPYRTLTFKQPLEVDTPRAAADSDEGAGDRLGQPQEVGS